MSDDRKHVDPQGQAPSPMSWPEVPRAELTAEGGLDSATVGPMAELATGANDAERPVPSVSHTDPHYLGRYRVLRLIGQGGFGQVFHSWPAGSLWPNDLGLFDILGNALEWCQERRSTTLKPEDSEDSDPVSNKIE